MKKKLLFTTLLAVLICVPVFAGTIVYKLYPVSYPVFVNGVPLLSNLPIMTYPTEEGDNTYVPLKDVLDMMGAKTEWNGCVNITTHQTNPQEVVNSVVEIYVVKNGKDVGQASGVIVDYDEIITCSHVAKGGETFRIIYNDGTVTQARLIEDEPSEDIAVLEPDRKDVKPCKIGDSDEVAVNDRIFTISSPKAKKNDIAEGTVLNFDKYIYSSAIGNAGSSGGAMFLKSGELIGMIRSGDKDSHMLTATPINEARKALAN